MMRWIIWRNIMLSKYYHLKQNNVEASKVDMSIFMSALVANLKEKYEDVKIERTFPGGTLGIFLSCILMEQKNLLKHINAEITTRKIYYMK